VFDPTEANPPSINVLAGPDPAFAVDQIIAVLRRCFASAWGPRIDDLLRASMLTLTHVNGQRACLVQLPALLTDPRYRARITGALTDDVLRGFWTSYEALTPGGRASLTAPVISKLRTFLLRPFIRNAIARADTSINLGDHLDAGGLILASATKGVLGDDAATLFGSLLLAHTWQHATRRTRTTQQQRRDAAIYVDETHNFLNLPGSISDVLAEARGYHLSLVLAHQHLTQLPPHLREAISANARNKIYFTASPEDAHQLRHHLAPALSEHDLAHLAAYQAAARLTIGGAQTRAFTLRTRPLPPPTPGRQDDVRQASRTHHTPPPQPAATPPPMRAGPPRRTGDPRITRP
jgi:hypothetical protein